MKKTTNKSAPALASSPCTQTAEDSIRTRIFTIRGVQVMLDRDLAELYGVPTKALNQAVKRNRERFPERFMFQLNRVELDALTSRVLIQDPNGSSSDLRSQFVTSSWGGRRHLPFAFTEQGVAMLSAVLKSDVSVQVSIQIMDAFVVLRRTLASMAPVISRLETVERRQIVDQSLNEERFETIFKAMGEGDFPPQKVFCDGRHYDAYSFARKLVRKAEHSIVLVDGYCDDVTLDILSCKRGGVKVTIATVAQTPITATAVMKFNKQNPPLEIRATGAFHDRFLILDGKELYHFGASLKDLGRHYCAVSKLDAAFIPSILGRFPQE